MFHLFMLNTWAHYLLQCGFKNYVQEHIELRIEIFWFNFKVFTLRFMLSTLANSFCKINT